MKKSYFLTILFILLALAGCSNPNSQKTIVAQTTLTIVEDQRQYTFSIVQTNGSSTRADEKSSYNGTFDLVVENDKGAQTSRKSLNNYFGKKELVFDGPVNLNTGDYNSDKFFDIPIGFPVDDGSGEYKYVIFSIDKDGKLFSFSAKGYKEEGYIYTAAGSYLNEFISGLGKGTSILVGVGKNGGGFEPAKYVWNGTQFEFKKESPFLINQVKIDAYDHKYLIKIIQTEYRKPLSPGEQDFIPYVSRYRGWFDLLVQNSSGEITSRVSINKYFDNNDLAFGGPIDLIFNDYNKDGDIDFGIGRPTKNPEFQCVLFSINSEGIVYNLPAGGYKEDGFIYSIGDEGVFDLLDNGENGIAVPLFDIVNNRYMLGKYLWNGSKFNFSNYISSD